MRTACGKAEEVLTGRNRHDSERDSEANARAGAIRRSHSAWVANFVVVIEKDGTARVYQDYRRLNALLQSDIGELGDIASNFNGLRSSTCLTSIDLASVDPPGNSRGRQAQDCVP